MRVAALVLLALLIARLHAQAPEMDPAMRDAIEKRDHDGLSRLLESKPDLAAIDARTKYSYLDLTFNNGDLAALKMLAAAGEDLNAPDGFPMPPLVYAAGMGQVEEVEFLLDHGAKLEGRDHTGATALVTAVNHRNEEMVRLLLKAGADFRAIDRRQASLLERAEAHNDAEIVALLRKAGATDGSPGKELMAAAAAGDVVHLRALIASGAPVDFAGENGETPLMAAAGKGQTVAVRALLAAGADARAVAKGGSWTPMFRAIESGHRSTVDEIWAAGGDPTATLGQSGVTTLMWLCSHAEDPELAQRLINAGVDPNAVTSNGSRFTALMQCATFGRTSMVRVLLKNGANVNVASVLEGDTALIDAARSGHVDVVEILLKAGADPTARDHRTKNGRPNGEPIPGKTALDWAYEYHHPDIAAVLENSSGVDRKP